MELVNYSSEGMSWFWNRIQQTKGYLRKIRLQIDAKFAALKGQYNS